MKKFILSAVTFGLLTAAAQADMPMAPAALPQPAQAFIQQHFKNTGIMYVEQDDDDVEVRLSDGTKIEFYFNGEWKEAKAYGNPLPVTMLPNPVANTLKKEYPQALIIKVEKEWNGYEIKLNNMMKLFIDGNGTLLGQKLDH